MATATLLLASIFTLMGQSDNQEFSIPLSEPGKKGILYAKTHRGAIKVSTHPENSVIVRVSSGEGEKEMDRGEKQGLRKIPNAATQFEITEENNIVKVQGVHNRHINFDILVPADFDLVINTHHDGYIEVNGVTGSIEADAHHEGISLIDVGGSVIADTHHGEIKVVLKSVTKEVPMAFSTYHGDIDLTFPPNVNARAKVKTTNGDIYTDFDLDLQVEPTELKSESEKGTKIKVSGWLKGDLGTGGPEFLFSTYHGDIIIRKGM